MRPTTDATRELQFDSGEAGDVVIQQQQRQEETPVESCTTFCRRRKYTLWSCIVGLLVCYVFSASMQEAVFFLLQGRTAEYPNSARVSTTIFKEMDDFSSAGTNDSIGLWTPSDEWIETCVRYENEQNALVHKRYKIQWPNYRLGDCIRFCDACRSSWKSSRYKKLSIAGEYWNVVCHRKNAYDRSRGNNFTFLDELFQRYEADPRPYRKPWPRPADDELVIHLRIGDVMDYPIYIGNTSVVQMLRDGADTRHGLNGADYPKGIKSIHDYLSLIRESNLTKVALHGGAHIHKLFPNSRIFTGCLSKAIRRAGYNISSLKVAGEDNPDQDFFYMSHAKYFVPSTGGYSHLIASFVERRGGTIIGSRFGRNKTEEERLKKAT